MKIILVFSLMIFGFVLNKSYCNDDINSNYQKALDYQKIEKYSDAIIYYNKAKSQVNNKKSEINALINWNLQFCLFKFNDINSSIIACKDWLNSGYYLGNCYNNLAYLYSIINDKANAALNYSLAITNIKNVYNGFELDEVELYGNLKNNLLASGEEFGFIPKSEFSKVMLGDGTTNYCKRELNYNEMLLDSQYKAAEAIRNSVGVKSEVSNNTELYEKEYLCGFSINISNNLPLPIVGVIIDFQLFNKQDKLIYRNSHAVIVNGLKSGYRANSNVFYLKDSKFITKEYVNNQGLYWKAYITDVAY